MSLFLRCFLLLLLLLLHFPPPPISFRGVQCMCTTYFFVRHSVNDTLLHQTSHHPRTASLTSPPPIPFPLIFIPALKSTPSLYNPSPPLPATTDNHPYLDPYRRHPKIRPELHSRPRPHLRRHTPRLLPRRPGRPTPAAQRVRCIQVSHNTFKTATCFHSLPPLHVLR